MPNRGLMANLFLPSTAAGLPPEVQQGLINDATRRAGLEMLARAQDPNIGRSLASFVGIGRDVAQQGAYDYLNQQQRQQQIDAQVDAQEALAEQRRERARIEREQATQKVNALKRNEAGIAQLRQELVGAGIDASLWPKEQVLQAHEELIQRRFDELHPEPLTPAQEQYGELTRGQQALTARELDLRSQGTYAQAPSRAQAPAPTSVDTSPEAAGSSPAGTPDPVMSRAVVNQLLTTRPDLAAAIEAARGQNVSDAEILATLRSRGLL